MSRLVLYRKYRPIKFSEVIGQNPIKQTLQNAVSNNRIGHAYLFAGPRGVGKTTLARILARAVNCPNQKQGEPCNECNICLELLKGTSLDVAEIDAASHTGVDNIREITDSVRFAPSRAKFRVIIVDEVHMLSKGAFNALLKTLEEPPAHVIFILATTEIHKVPATIISRTQRFDFKRIGASDLIKLLKSISIDAGIKVQETALAEIAEAADGSFRDSLSLLDQLSNYEGEITMELTEEVLGLTSIKTTGQFLDLILENKTKEALEFLSSIAFAGKDLYQFQKDFLEYLRKVLLLKMSDSEDLGIAIDAKVKIIEQGTNLSKERVLEMIEVFMKAGQEIKFSPILSLPLEVAIVSLTSVRDSSLRATAKQSQDEEQDDEIVSAQTHHNDSDPNALQKVLDNWETILEKIKEYNHSLLSSLKLAKPESIEGKELILVFPYKFHKDTIDARKNRLVVDQVIEDVTGIKLMVKPILRKLEGIDPKNNSLKSALEILGGEVE